MIYLPDISHHHPVTDWDKIEMTCPILITKATEGNSYVDPTLKVFIKECEKRHIPYWLYTFLRKGNELDQTKFMVSVCKDLVGDFFVGYILDIESGNKEADCISSLEWLKTKCNKQMVYTMYSQYSNYAKMIKGRGDSCAWWEARYGKNDGLYHAQYPCHEGVDLYQFTSQGTVPGLSGHIDLNKIVGKKNEQWFMKKEEKKEVKMNTISLTTICKDCICPEVAAWKKLLIASGYKDGVTTTERFGSKAEEMTKKWQKDNGLTPDGIVGAKSWSKMLLG